MAEGPPLSPNVPCLLGLSGSSLVSPGLTARKPLQLPVWSSLAWVKLQEAGGPSSLTPFSSCPSLRSSLSHCHLGSDSPSPLCSQFKFGPSRFPSVPEQLWLSSSAMSTLPSPGEMLTFSATAHTVGSSVHP